MKPKLQIKAIAELDGFETLGVGPDYQTHFKNGEEYKTAELPAYHTSRDAVVPVIEKQSRLIQDAVVDELHRIPAGKCPYAEFATPSQLCEALLRATGKWVV